MGLIHEIRCTECEFCARVLPRLLFAIRHDGREVLLPEFEEHGVARDYAGMSLKVALEEGLLRRRDGYLCLSCGEAGYYGFENGLYGGVIDSDFEEDCDADGEILYDFVQSENVHRSERLKCLACGQASLEVAGGRPGWGAGIVKFLLSERGWRQRQQNLGRLPRCPHCERGLIFWQRTWDS